MSTKSNIEHYILAFTDSNGYLQIHDKWLEKIDKSQKNEVDKVKIELFRDYYDAEESTIDFDILKNSEFFKDSIISIGVKKPIEDKLSDNCIYNKVIQRWDVAEKVEPELANEPKYEVTIKSDGDQISIDVVPFGNDDPESLVDLPQMSVFLEINGGLPCIHIHNNLYGEVAQSIYCDGHDEIYVRPGDASADVHTVSSSYQPNAVEVADRIEFQKAKNQDNIIRSKMRENENI